MVCEAIHFLQRAARAQWQDGVFDEDQPGQ